MLVICAEKSSLAKTIASVLGAGQRIAMQGEPIGIIEGRKNRSYQRLQVQSGQRI